MTWNCAPGDDDWPESLTERDIAELAALDDAADPLDGGERRSWPAKPAEDPEAASDPRPVPEVLPWLLPRDLGTGWGFDAGGVVDRLPPGPVLAGLASNKWDTGLGQASDDELAGLMLAWRRISSWAAAGELAAIGELDRRREAQVAAGADPQLAEHMPDEIAMVLTLTSRAAGRLVDRAVGLARLPRTAAALRAGQIDVAKALVILGETTGLDAPHAAKVEAAVLGRAPGQTTGELCRAVRRQVIAADPDAARRRKDRAAKQARVERWSEDAGTAALAGRDLPPAEVLAADAHLTTWARRLKAAGVDRNLDQLRATVYLALLNGQDPETLLPAADATPARSSGPADTPASHSQPAEPGGFRARATARGSVNLILPVATWLGWSAAPGEATGYGPLDAEDSRALATALARDPGTRWCVTITGADRRAVAHGCAKAGHGQPPPEPARRPRAGKAGSGPGEGPGPPPGIPAWLTGVSLEWLERGRCEHRRETRGYRPSALLAHLIRIRQQTCTAPGCRRPAVSCDFEHTIPYHQGGRTCECNGGSCCRHHHRAKQAAGWQLSQPQPGTFTWTTPHGRSYTTRPAEYPC